MTEPAEARVRTKIERWLLVLASLGATAGALFGAAEHYQSLGLRAAEAERAQGELTLRQSDQRHAVRMAYLNLTTGEKAKGDVLRVLRYVAALDDDPRMKKWAEDEKKHVELEYQRLADLREQQDKVADLSKQLAEAQRDKRTGEVTRLSQALLEQRKKTATAAAEVIPPLKFPEMVSSPLLSCELDGDGQRYVLQPAETAAACKFVASQRCMKQGFQSCSYTWNGSPLEPLQSK